MHDVGLPEATACLRFAQEEASRKNKGKAISPDTFRGYFLALSGLWNWAVKRRKIASNPFPAAYAEIAYLPAPEQLKPKKEYTSPESLRRMLAWALEHQPRMLPALAIIAFCGLRPSEAHRLKWRDVTLDAKNGSAVHIGEQKTKTGNSRIVDLCPACEAWLRVAWAKIGMPQGHLHVIPTMADDDSEAGEKARKYAWDGLLSGIKAHCAPDILPEAGDEVWPRDLLRHSFGTYYRAMTGSILQTAEQMGNSRQICKEHYSRPVLKAQGKAYFNVFPPTTPAAS